MSERKDPLEQFKKDVRFTSSHVEEWTKQYPDKWIAVYEEELVAVAASHLKVLRLVDKKGIPRGHVVTRHLITKKINLKLEMITNGRRCYDELRIAGKSQESLTALVG
jgi:hypothetical protein